MIHLKLHFIKWQSICLMIYYHDDDIINPQKLRYFYYYNKLCEIMQCNHLMLGYNNNKNVFFCLRFDDSNILNLKLEL